MLLSTKCLSKFKSLTIFSWMSSKLDQIQMKPPIRYNLYIKERIVGTETRDKVVKNFSLNILSGQFHIIKLQTETLPDLIVSNWWL